MSLAGLRSRLAKLEAEAARREAAAAAHAGAKLQTTLAPVQRWSEFALRTWIKTGDEAGNKIVPFRSYGYQDDLVRDINENEKIIVLKSRQLGVSEVIVSYLLNRALTEPGFVATIISKTQKDSAELAIRAKFMAKSIQGESLEWESESTTKLAWQRRGTLHFMPATGRAGRGIPACAVLFLDEGAFIEGVDEIYRGAAPSLAKLGKAGKIIVVSTPDLEADWYGQMWSRGLPSDWYDLIENRPDGKPQIAALQALLDTVKDGWKRVPIHHCQHPEYGADPGWAERYRRELKYTQAQWDSEFELKFGSTSSVIYPSPLVKRAARGAMLDCGVYGRTYSLGIDPNGGGADYFTAIMLDITTTPRSVVHMYSESHRSTPYSLKHIKDMIDNFLPSEIIVERNSMGVVIAEALQAQNQGYNVETIYMSEPTKNIITDRVLYLLEQDDLIFPDGEIASELRAFRRTESGKREAAAGHHDDKVMALALAASKVPELVDLAGFLQFA